MTNLRSRCEGRSSGRAAPLHRAGGLQSEGDARH